MAEPTQETVVTGQNDGPVEIQVIGHRDGHDHSSSLEPRSGGGRS
jgi:hypothetical protein